MKNANRRQPQHPELYTLTISASGVYAAVAHAPMFDTLHNARTFARYSNAWRGNTGERLNGEPYAITHIKVFADSAPKNSAAHYCYIVTPVNNIPRGAVIAYHAREKKSFIGYTQSEYGAEKFYIERPDGDLLVVRAETADKAEKRFYNYLLKKSFENAKTAKQWLFENPITAVEVVENDH